MMLSMPEHITNKTRTFNSGARDLIKKLVNIMTAVPSVKNKQVEVGFFNWSFRMW